MWIERDTSLAAIATEGALDPRELQRAILARLDHLAAIWRARANQRLARPEEVADVLRHIPVVRTIATRSLRKISAAAPVKWPRSLRYAGPVVDWAQRSRRSSSARERAEDATSPAACIAERA
jgi:hypothetical protein